MWIRKVGLPIVAVAGALAFLLILAWGLYSPGFHGELLFDDRANLDGLSAAHTDLGIISFVFGGEAGPTGRPVALATFALQRQYWPTDLYFLFQTNVAIHLVTGFAVFFFALGVARAIRFRHPEIVALLTSGLWLLSPFLASAPLMLVQRMTVLAGAFVFLGLAAYVWGRIIHFTRPLAGAALMSFGIIAGTILATLSKENGALLPLLALVTEITLLRRVLPVSSRGIRAFQWIFLGVPAVLILVYLVAKVPSLFEPAGFRGFTVSERLAMQPAILWEYIRYLLIPASESVTPFTDDRSGPSGWLNIWNILSALGWLVLLGVSVVLRRRIPILLFSVCFFLAGHILESSIINLELYFAHRNYVPAFGLYFGLAAALTYAAATKPRIVLPAGATYIVLFAIVLVFSTSLWGQPRLAAEVWVKQQPTSLRAHEFLANQHFENGDAYTARRVLEHGASLDLSGTLGVLSLYTCVFEEPLSDSVSRSVRDAKEKIRYGTYSHSMGKAVLQLTVRVLDGYCDAISSSDLLEVIDAVIANPSYKANTATMVQLLNAKALIARSSGDIESALTYIGKMYRLSGNTNHAIVYAALLKAQGRTMEALQILEEAKEGLPRNPIKRFVRARMLAEQVDLILAKSENSGTPTFVERPAPPR